MRLKPVRTVSKTPYIFLQNCSEPGRLASEELDAIVKQQQGVNQSNLSAIYESNQQSELSSVAR